MKKGFGKLLIALIILGVGLYAFAGNYIDKSLEAVDPNDSKEITVEIPEGSSTGEIAEILYKNGLIKNTAAFKYYAKKTNSAGQMQSGSFVLSKDMNTDELIMALIEGGTSGNTTNITIIEGLTIQEASKSIAEQMGLDYDILLGLMEDADKFRNDYNFLSDNPDIKNLQGYLMPETYNVYKTSDEEAIVRMLLSQFESFYESDMLPLLKNSKLNTADAVNLASIVEKEAVLDEERDDVAKTFLNRLDINMKLQSCATVNYAQGEWKERLSAEDTEIDSPYNTYVHEGLPPTPINSPGKKSIISVLTPADVDYLYFVAKGDGSHYFSNNYEDHVAAKNKYLK